MPDTDNPSTPSKPKLSDIIKSVAASVFGVQSQRNHQRDFQQQSFVPYVVVGVVFVVLLVVALVIIVSQIVPA